MCKRSEINIDNLWENLDKNGICKVIENKKFLNKYKIIESDIQRLKQLLKDTTIKDEQIRIEIANHPKLNPANLKNFLFEERQLTEEIVPQVLEKFEELQIKNGKICATLSISLSPFFKEKTEDN